MKNSYLVKLFSDDYYVTAEMSLIFINGKDQFVFVFKSGIEIPIYKVYHYVKNENNKTLKYKEV